MQKIIFFFLTFIITQSFLFGQAVGEEYNKEILRKETSWGIVLNSNGYGLTYRQGKEKSIFKKVLFEVDLAVKKNPKEIKAKNPFFTNSKDYVFGKLNRFNLVHAGIGVQNVLNLKPYWGGTEVRYVAFTGLSLGMSSPVYLYIINFVPGTYETNLTTERYDPDKHNVDNIYGNGPFAKGFFNITPHPGVFGKLGLNFEFGNQDRKLRSLETGFCLEAYLNPIQIMAFNDPQRLFFSFYLGINFGSRKDYY